MSKMIRKIWNIATTILVTLAVLLAFLLWGVRFLNIEVFVVQSGSMEPAYHTGSLVYIKETAVDELKVGDVITFKLSEGLRGTHRIIEVVKDGQQIAFRTKGDANEEADNGLVDPANVIGKVIFTIPYLGFLVTYIQQPPGLYLAVAIAAVILLLVVLPEIIFDDKKKTKKQEASE